MTYCRVSTRTNVGKSKENREGDEADDVKQRPHGLAPRVTEDQPPQQNEPAPRQRKGKSSTKPNISEGIGNDEGQQGQQDVAAAKSTQVGAGCVAAWL